MGHKKVIVKEVDIILSLRAVGETYRFIGQRIGLSYGTLKKIEKGKRGIKISKRSKEKVQRFFAGISRSRRKSDKVLTSMMILNINKLATLSHRRDKLRFVKQARDEKSSAKVLAKEYEKKFTKKGLKEWNKGNKYSPYIQFLKDYYENLLKGIKLTIKES